MDRKEENDVAHYLLPEVIIYPNNKFGDIARSQGITTARNWRKVKEGTTAGINEFGEKVNALGQIIASFLPVVSDVQDAKDFYDAYTEGDKLGMTLAALGFIPFFGGAATNANRFLRRSKKIAKVEDKIAEKASDVQNLIEDRVQGVKDYIKYRKAPSAYDAGPDLYFENKGGNSTHWEWHLNKPYRVNNGNVKVYSEYADDEPYRNVRKVSGRAMDRVTSDNNAQRYYYRTPETEYGEYEPYFAEIYPDRKNTVNYFINDYVAADEVKRMVNEAPVGSYHGGDLNPKNKYTEIARTQGEKLRNAKNPISFIDAIIGPSTNPKISNYSTDSYPLILRGANRPDRELRYIEGSYSPLNGAGISDRFKLGTTKATNAEELAELQEKLEEINATLKRLNPKARKARIKDGEIVFPHMMILKTK